MTATREDPIPGRVREAWSAHLRHHDFGADDDFFDVGGHSVLVAHVMATLTRDLGARLPLRLFFDNPTVAGLSAAIATHLDRT